MVKKQYVIPGVLLGIVTLLGGHAALAFGGDFFESEAFSHFSAEEQTAIQKAHDIHVKAQEEAHDVLEAAGVTREEMHAAMRSFHEKERAAMHEALGDNDFEGFKALVAGSKMDEHLTEEMFDKLVEIHSLETSGDREGAREIRMELKDEGLMFMGRGMGHHVLHKVDEN
jgi:hypothetical protein